MVCVNALRQSKDALEQYGEALAAQHLVRTPLLVLDRDWPSRRAARRRRTGTATAPWCASGQPGACESPPSAIGGRRGLGLAVGLVLPAPEAGRGDRDAGPATGYLRLRRADAHDADAAEATRDGADAAADEPATNEGLAGKAAR